MFSPIKIFTFSTSLAIPNDNVNFTSAHTHFQQTFLYLYAFLYIVPDDGLLEAETSRMGSYMTNYYFYLVVKFFGLNTVLSRKGLM